MEWRDFTDESEPQLHAYRDDPWVLEAAGDEPTIYLNSSVEGFRAVLEGAGSGPEKALRDVLATHIASEAWVCMFNAAAYAAMVEDGDAQWPGGWQEDVLRRMLPDIFPDRSPDDALVEVVSRREDGHNGGDLQTRVLHAAAVQAMTPKKVTAALRTLVRAAGTVKETTSE
jgi:hypothetical protein